MEDFPTIIIYIIILVVGGIISATKNKNKRKSILMPPLNPQSRTDLEENPPPVYNPLEEFLKKYEIETNPQYETLESEPEVMMQPEEASLEEIITTPEEEGVSAVDKTYDNNYNDSFENDNIIASGQITDAIGDEEIESENAINFVDNIVNGIIYSEILKRKQF